MVWHSTSLFDAMTIKGKKSQCSDQKPHLVINEFDNRLILLSHFSRVIVDVDHFAFKLL